MPNETDLRRSVAILKLGFYGQSELGLDLAEFGLVCLISAAQAIALSTKPDTDLHDLIADCTEFFETRFAEVHNSETGKLARSLFTTLDKRQKKDSQS